MSCAPSGCRGLATELVIDASALVQAALVEEAHRQISRRALHAPSLIWSEATSAIRQLEYRGELSRSEADKTLERLRATRLTIHASNDLAVEATRLARELGWAKTYDA